ncbi:excalibur calcium-binding domain-containing protein [Streptomyces sp. NPDC057193]|uniref:excalibur calcium-binding domain-containing protein n=1 Tax=Streptomyces sp. NPDC057193 TaxID=3346043 RepID=UPI0036380C3B
MHPLPPPPPPYPYAPAPARRWWQHPALIIVLLVLFPPAGIALVWTSLWKQPQKIVATVLSGLWFLLSFLVPSSEETKDDAKPAPKPAVTAAATRTPTPTSPTPTPTPSATVAAMPLLVGGSYADAEPLLTAHLGRAYGAYKDVDLPSDHGTWTVCFQRPDAGAPIATTVPVVYLTKPGVPCPKSPNEVLRKPTPTPEPTTRTPTPAPEPTRTRAPEPTQEADDDTSSGGGSVSYANCAAVRAAGAAPIHAGDPGYSRRLDRDGDGVACEG